MLSDRGREMAADSADAADALLLRKWRVMSSPDPGSCAWPQLFLIAGFITTSEQVME